MPQNSISLKRGEELAALLFWLDRQQGLVIAMQRELVSRPALNPEHGGTGEDAKLQWVEARLREYGVTDFTRLDYADARVPGAVRGNLVARLHGRADASDRLRTLWLISHLDVFPPGPAEEWGSNPFTLRVDGDILHGRGVEDNHQGIVTSLLLVEALRTGGIVPHMNVGLVFCSGALVGYDMNIKHILDRMPGIFAPDDFVLVLDHGSQDGTLIEVAEKGNVWLRFTVTGREGHAGSPQEAVNAFAVGAEVIRALRGLEAVFPARNPFFTPPVSTFSPTVSENHSRAANNIPGKFVFYVDVRMLPEYSLAELEQAMRDLADKVGGSENARIDLEVVEQTPFAAATPVDAPVVRLLGRSIEAQLGVSPRPGGIGGVTMASAIRERGIEVAVWGILTNWRNRTGEQASIANHIAQSKVLARLLFHPEAARGTGAAENGAGNGR